MGRIAHVAIWPIRAFWRATSVRNHHHGSPFTMTSPAAIDGGEIRHEGLRMRIWGIAAPGIDSTGGLASQATLEDLMLFRNMHVIPMGVDETGRMLVQVWCGRGDIGRAMVRQGYARATAGRYRGAERRARKERAGLWASSTHIASIEAIPA